jgi:DegV family protein with EDD domain
MTQEITSQYNIRLVPLYISIDGKSYLENEVDLAWFYKQLPKWTVGDRLPVSSSPPPCDFLRAYRELSQRSEAVLHISLSSKLSATFDSLLQAKKMAEAETPQIPFAIINTFTVCGAQMLITIEAARAAANGKSLPEVVAVAEKMVGKVNHISVLDDLSLLAKGGRIHRGRVWAGSKVSNTALMEITIATGGEYRPIARYKTREKALEALLEIVKEGSDNRRLHVAINHTDALARAEELKEWILSRFRCAEFYITPILPVVTTHNGLGALKLSWWAED